MQFDQFNRREFITLLRGAPAAWPLIVHAQQPVPVIGWLSAISERAAVRHQAQFRRGLGENGLVLGQNVASNTAGRTANTIACRRWRRS
jgi:hypothetical protein